MFLPVVLCGSVRASSAAAAVPTAPAGAVFAAVAHPSCCRSDAACTVPCGDGDSARWVYEIVTGTWIEQATSGKRCILRSAGGGKWYLDAPDNQGYDLPNVAAFQQQNSFTYASLSTTYSTTDYRVILDRAHTTNQPCLYIRNDLLDIYANGNEVYSPSAIPVNGTPFVGKWGLQGYPAGPVTFTVQVDNGSAGSATVGDGARVLSRWDELLSSSAHGQYLVGRFYALVSFPVAQDDDSAARAWLARYTP